MNVMPQYTNVQSSTQNVSSADNQQATPWKKWESPQRLHAEYPNGKATLLGILYTDGCLSRKSKYTWRFYLGNTSLEIIMVFRACMMNIFGLDDQRIRIAQKMVNGKPYYSAIVDSGRWGNLLITQYGTFRTLAYKDENGEKLYPYTHLPFNASSNQKEVSDFLRAAFSCDGGVNLYVGKSKAKKYKSLIHNVFLSCHHPKLQRDYCNLLSYLGIKPRLLMKDNKIRIERREDLQKFQEKVGFLKGVKITQHSKYWQGWEKNVVLNLALSSYGNAKSILNLPQFLG